jgi:glycerol-3-phosphate dehydrogenase
MSDAQVEFPERLVAEAVREFVDAGGVALNHVSAVWIASPGHKLRGLLVRDELASESAAKQNHPAMQQLSAKHHLPKVLVDGYYYAVL